MVLICTLRGVYCKPCLQPISCYCCATADILTKLLQQCFLFFIVVVIPGHNLGNSQVSVNRTIGPTLVFHYCGYTWAIVRRALIGPLVLLWLKNLSVCLLLNCIIDNLTTCIGILLCKAEHLLVILEQNASVTALENSIYGKPLN